MIKRLLLLAIAAAAAAIALPAVTNGVSLSLTCTVTASSAVLTACSPAPTSNAAWIDTQTAVIVGTETTARVVTAVTSSTITLATTPASGQAGTGVNVQKVADAIDHGALRIYATFGTACYPAIAFGTSSGTYPYRSYQGTAATTLARMAIGGINPATQYFFQIQCNATSGTGSGQGTGTEFSITTPAVVGTHPTLPVPPAAWTPPTINTAGYTVFPVPAFADGTVTGSITTGTPNLTVSSGAGFAANHWIRIAGAVCNLLTLPALPDCQIASVSGTSVTLTSNVSGTAANAAITWSLYTLSDWLYASHSYHFTYPTLIQFAQGYQGVWYAQNQGHGSNGIELGGLSKTVAWSGCANPASCAFDDVNYPRIVFDTAPTPATLRPAGYQGNPADAGNYATIAAQSPGTNPGEIFTLDLSGALNPHHYAIRHLNLAINPAVGANSTDPQPMQGIIGESYAGGTTVAQLPAYIDIDSNVIAPPSATTRITDGIITAGSYISVRNNWIVTDYARPFQPLSNPCTLGTGTVAVAQQQWKFNSADNSFSMPGTATYTFTGSGGYAGTLWMQMTSAGLLNAQYTNAATGGGSISASCSGAACGTLTASTNTSGVQHAAIWNPADVPVCSASIANSVTSNVTNFADSDWLGGTEGSHALAAGDGPGPMYAVNNHLEGYGIGFFIDIGQGTASANDVVFRANQFNWSTTHLPGQALSNGYNYRVRNLWEIKQGRRWLLAGNDFSGNFANINAGNAVLLSGRFTTGGCNNNGNENLEGISDVEVAYNWFHDTVAGIYVQGGNAGTPGASCGSYLVGDPPLTSRTNVHDNGFSNLDSGFYAYNPASADYGECLRLLFGPTDLTIHHNFCWGTGLTPVTPGFMFLNYVASEGIDYRSNLSPMNVGSSGVPGLATDTSLQVSGYSYQPAITTTNWATLYSTMFPRLGSTASAQFRWNMIPLGWCALSTDCTSTDVTNYSSPSGTTFNSLGATSVFALGNTSAARLAAAGVPNAAAGDMTCGSTAQASCQAGPNVAAMLAYAGIISQIKAYAGPTNIQVSYLAPDANPVWLGILSGGTWTYVSDGGGARPRTVTSATLSSSTTYTWALFGYRNQSSIVFPSEHSNMITTGTLTTLASGTRTAYIGGNLPSGASKAVMSGVPISGSGTVSNTCTSFPCPLAALSVGPFVLTYTYQTSGGTPVGPTVSLLTQ